MSYFQSRDYPGQISSNEINQPKEENTSERVEKKEEKSSKTRSFRDYVKKFGVIGFLFFFIKGLLWLIIPYLIALYYTS